MICEIVPLASVAVTVTLPAVKSPLALDAKKLAPAATTPAKKLLKGMPSPAILVAKTGLAVVPPAKKECAPAAVGVLFTTEPTYEKLPEVRSMGDAVSPMMLNPAKVSMPVAPTAA